MSELIIVENPNAMKEINRDAFQFLEKQSSVILVAVKDECPFETGKLMESLGIDLDEENIRFAITSDVEYFPYVYLGTRYQDPNPFIDRALRKMK